jgi:hypothetical protein
LGRRPRPGPTACRRERTGPRMPVGLALNARGGGCGVSGFVGAVAGDWV